MYNTVEKDPDRKKQNIDEKNTQITKNNKNR